MLKKVLILFAVVLTLLGVYAWAGFYLVPKLARERLPELLSDLTGQSAELQAVHFHPFELKADLQGARLLSPDGKPWLAFAELAVDVDVLESLEQKALIIGSLDLRQPELDIERDAEGRFNFNSLLEKVSQSEQPSPESSENSGFPPVAIHRIRLAQGRLGWVDRSMGRTETETVQAIELSITEFTTRPDAISPYALASKLASGGGLDIQGEFNLSAASSKGSVKLDGIALAKLRALALPQDLPLEIGEGRLSLAANYVLDAKDGADVQLSVDGGRLEFRQLTLTEKNKADALLHLPLVAANGIRLNLKDRRVDIDSIASNAAEIKAWLQADGRFNYQSLFDNQPSEPVADVSPEESAASTAWRISLGELALNGYQIAFTDFSQAKPVEMHFDELDCVLRDYHNTDGIKLPLQFRTRFNKLGHLKLSGDLGLSPFSANWAVDLAQIKLKSFQAYLDPYLNLELVDGELSTKGQLQIVAADDLQVNYQGDAAVNSLLTRDKAKNLDFVKWANLELRQMTLDASKQDFKLGEVVFDQPYVRFTIKKDGSNNVDDILVAKKEVGPKAPTQPVGKNAEESAKNHQPVVTIGKIALEQGQSDFADYSLILPFVVKMNDLNGQIDGFASNTDDAAKLKLRGKVLDLATVNIAGNYQLKSGDSDIALSFKHLPLPLVTPYMAEFAGYRIEKGQMALDLTYNIKRGKLAAHNKIFIDQLALGEKVENPKAVSLPLELGIALLKDGDGKINLDFPVTGSLEDPKFSVGSLVTDVLVNLITKTVSAPFKAIASLFDSDADLSTIGFAAGNIDLSVEEQTKLQQIAKALNVKPELVLEIKGLAYQQQDWPVMRHEALMDVLKKMKSGELRDKGEKIRSEYLELSESEYKRLLAKFYAEVFPDRIEHGLFGAPRIKSKPDADFYAVAREELEAVMPPEPQRLNELAVSRANRIVKYLTEQGGIARDRLYIMATEVDTSEHDGPISVRLSLNVAS
ncbi:MAG: DUF748 domain-containing protein [Methylomonas sp.]|nr:DUF748 domain-containing protein [Methylomonas sp.]